MENETKKLFLLKDANVSTALLKLGIPTMVGMLIAALYNVVDTFFVAKLGTSQMGAVSIVFPIGTIMTGIALLFGSGASSYLARLLGNRQHKEADSCASTALFTSVCIGGICILFLLLIMTPILKCLGATPTILPYARQYGYVFVFSLLFNVFNVTVNNIITAEGASRFSMIAMFCGGMLNAGLDPVMIYVLHMGVMGAAAATLVANMVSTTLYVSYIFGRKSVFHISLKKLSIDKKIYMEIFKVGLPILAFQILTSVAVGITNFIAADYGDSVVAAIGIEARVIALGTMAVFGFLKGFQPFVGYNYGAKNWTRVEEAKKFALRLTSCFCILVAAGLIAFSSNIVELFNKNDLIVMKVGKEALILNGIVFATLGFQLVYGTFYLALGKSKQGGILSICRQGLFFIPLVLILPQLFGVQGILFAQPIADIGNVFLTGMFAYGVNYRTEVN